MTAWGGDLPELVWEFVDDFFDVVGLVAVGDEDGVIGLDDDEVIDAEEGDFGAFSCVEDDVVLGVDFGEVGVGAVLLALGLEVFCDGDPGADVVPVKGGLDVEDAGGFFHEGVVDGDGGEVGELLGDGGEDVGGIF